MGSIEPLRLFNLEFERRTLNEAANDILNFSRDGRKGLIVTPNVDHVVLTQKNADLLDIFTDASYRFADGMPLVWLSKILYGSNSLPERVTGADLLPEICRIACRSGERIYFLGGNPGVAAKAADVLTKSYPGLNICGFYCPPFGFENNDEETKKIINDINACGTNILFIGVGMPKQEIWASRHLSQLNVGPILCVGAAFDFAAGIQKRAPLIMQKLGLEWFWRLLSEPKRMWRRYILRDSQFVFLALKEVYKHKIA